MITLRLKEAELNFYPLPRPKNGRTYKTSIQVVMSVV